MEQLTPLLKELAEKLGTTIEHLWSVLIKQANVEIMLCHIRMNIGLYGFGGLSILCLLLLWMAKKRDWDEDGKYLSGILAFVFLVTGVVLYIANYMKLVTLQTNPEYWAINEILSSLK